MSDALEVSVAPEIDRAAVADAVRRGQAAIQDAADGQLAPYGWEVVEDAVTDAVVETIERDWLGWLAHGWSAVREILEYGKEEKARVNRTAFVKLGKHELKGTMPVNVTVSCGGAPLTTLPFQVPIKVELSAVTLSILKGHIVAAGGGECKITLRIKYGKADLSGELPVKTFRLPGKHRFERPGIAIPRVGGEA
jgi:hypothetical protein